MSDDEGEVVSVGAVGAEGAEDGDVEGVEDGDVEAWWWVL